MVFFCGAGLSAGTGLPTFPDLVQELDEILNPNSADRFGKGRTDYDRMLSELESGFTPGLMREHVRRILSESPRDPKGVLSSDEVLENHRNILRLAAIHGGGTRLVTTNFDDRFLLAANGMSILHDDAPKLPVPEASGWASLVHLHGRICNGGNLNDLVLNSGDFGRAYLSEGWARRFVVRLMRHWPVAFVGYRLDDPPMRYLMDAVYDRRGDSKGFERAFALVGCEAGEEGKRRREWEDKWVVPILYNKANNHESLREVLDNLARLKGEPDYRAKLAIRGVDKAPDDENGDNGRRVVWALRDPVAAEGFAEKKAFPEAGDENKFIRWLDAFKEQGLFEAEKTDSERRVNALNYPPYFPPDLSAAAKHLTNWAARHAHQPALLRWLAGLDASLHPEFVGKLHWRIFGKGGAALKIPEELRDIWGVFLQSHPVDAAAAELLDKQVFWMENLPPKAASELEQRILSALRPIPVVVPDGHPGYADADAKNFGVRVEVRCGLRRFRWQDDDILRMLEGKRSADFVLRSAEVLSGYLERTLSIMAWDKTPTTDMKCLLPEADKFRRGGYWQLLARAVRDGARGLIRAKKHRRLANLISQWAESEHPLLWRMALYAAAETAKHYPEFRGGGNWGAKILTEKCEALWGNECRPECLRFLRRAGGTIAAAELSGLEDAILAGPPEKCQVSNLDGTRDEAVAFRLAKLERGAKLSRRESGDFLEVARKKFPDIDFGKETESWELKSRGGGPRVPRKDNLARFRAGMSPHECANMIKQIRAEEGWLDVSEFVKGDPERAIAAYEELAAEGVWEGVNWHDFLTAPADHWAFNNRRATRLISVLNRAPDDFLVDDDFGVAYALHSLARILPFSDMEKIWRKAWRNGAGKEIQECREDGTVRGGFMDTCGMLAEVVFMRMSREKDNPRFFKLLEEILKSRAPGHKHGRAVVGGCAASLFFENQQWTKEHVLPMFDEGHPDSLHAWVEFLKPLEMSENLAGAMKIALINVAKHTDKFGDLLWPHFAELAFHVCDRFPNVFRDEDQRRLVDNMGRETLQALCKRLQWKLQHANGGAARGKIWRDSIGPFMERAWPQRHSVKTPKNAELLGNIVIRTGDEFPDAVDWAKDFLSPIEHPIASTSGGIIWALDKTEGDPISEIPGKFPEACLRFLHRVVNLKDGRQYKSLKLRSILDRIEEAQPELRKRKEFRELRDALAQ